MGKEATEENFKLVGFTRFVRTNPRSDRFPVLRFHHVEFWAADATNSAGRFSFGLGMPLAARSDLSTGNPFFASYLLRSASLRFLFSAPYGGPAAADAAANSATPSPIPSFDADRARRFSVDHGLAVRAIAVEVADAAEAFRISVAHGARPSFPPADLGQGFALAEVELYGDVVLRYVSRPKTPPFPSEAHRTPVKLPAFLPGFEDVDESETSSFTYGIRRLDHAVGNVPELAPAVRYIAGFTGFHEFAEFTADDVGTAESGLNSVVLANNEETVLVPLNEPVHGTKRRSQIQTYLDHNGGAGVQHLALASDDVLKTLREMRARTGMGGFDFMPPPPPNYYQGCVGEPATCSPRSRSRSVRNWAFWWTGMIKAATNLHQAGRPTIFIEIIQRIGCMVKDKEGKEYQKGGCGGFGKGNFSELFKSIEDYEKSLEAKQATTVPSA
ncbi:4-hydroxyphenylpyruvate dioxygenase [Musa troglodytarum]|uniref:4-hydroxyphenylpyruvate dioxygenase n=1 Tax=Musa troglodytarum TaxID=320322 RepID=A0A9E7GV86_9LILI|nr:4-hydroxyphenylpyruvate dioxygenase [Musa troglodytarum]